MTEEIKNEIQLLIQKHKNTCFRNGPFGRSGLADIASNLSKDTLRVLEQIIGQLV